jgi:glyoxylase-like metal-dependent hydrolase (beta-lactamase superfamily II)
MYTIKPIYLGTFHDHEKTGLTFKKDPGKMIDIPILVYLIEGNGRTILVDSGPPNPDRAAKMSTRPISDGKYLHEELQKAGIALSKIECILLSHAHWDHSYNFELFPNVPIYVQKKELQYAVAPLPSDSRTYPMNLQDGLPGWVEGFLQMKVIDGDYDFMDGISLVLLPGHTPGSQGVLVKTTEGNALICADAFPLYENYEQGIASGNHVDLREWYASYEKAKRLCDYILPGHDPKVLGRKTYG